MLGRPDFPQYEGVKISTLLGGFVRFLTDLTKKNKKYFSDQSNYSSRIIFSHIPIKLL